jgi:hypothetical protein
MTEYARLIGTGLLFVIIAFWLFSKQISYLKINPKQSAEFALINCICIFLGFGGVIFLVLATVKITG